MCLKASIHAINSHLLLYSYLSISSPLSHSHQNPDPEQSFHFRQHRAGHWEALFPNSIHAPPPTNILHSSFCLYHQVQKIGSKISSLPLQMFSQVTTNPLWSANSCAPTPSPTPKTSTPKVATCQGPPSYPVSFERAQHRPHLAFLQPGKLDFKMSFP